MGEHAECAIVAVFLPTPTPSLCPAPPATLASRTCATPMPRAQVEVAGADAQAEVGAWVGFRGRGASPSAAGVVRCFPDPSPVTAVALPRSFSLPQSAGVACCPLTPTLRHQRLPTSWVAHGLVHPRPPPLGSRAASPTLPRVARLIALPPRWKRGGSSAERTGVWGCTREAPAPSAGAKGRARKEGHAAQEEGM